MAETHAPATSRIRTRRFRVPKSLDRTDLIQNPAMKAYGLLTSRRPDPGVTLESLTEQIRHGLKVESVRYLGRHLGLPIKDILAVIGMSAGVYARRRVSGTHLKPLHSDRVYRLARVVAPAAEVFSREDIAQDWLVTYNSALGTKPFELLDTEVGVEQVEVILTRIEDGVCS